jgi:DNA-directed RNA polymerase subunit RPC12/RpoP
MGVIAMEVTGSFISHGVSHLTQAAYIYCDTCGSFRITKTLSGRQWALILGIVFIDAALKYFGFPWWGLIVMTFALCIPLMGLWGVSGYRCLKCGHGTTIRYNTRNYQSVTGILDVPKEQIEKVYFNYWTDDGDLEENLKPPEPQTDKNSRNQK